MPRRPNYRFERAERNRAKEVKKEEKLKHQQERLSTRDGDDAAPPAVDPQQSQG